MLEWKEYFKNVKPLSFTMIGIVFAVFCLVLLGGGVLTIEKFGGVGLADCIQIAIMFIIAGTMIVGVRAHNYEKSYSQSETNLTGAISLVDRAALILQPDGVLTNDRVAWVTCARLITRAEALKNKITTETHRQIFEAEHDLRRHYFLDLLKQDGKALTGAFFCGGNSTRSIGDTVTDSLHPENGSIWIPERIINVVYKFMSFPDGYEDPLDISARFSEKERRRLGLLGYDGIKEYVDFRNNFYPLGRKILSNNKSSPCVAQTASDIDCCVFTSQYDFDDL